MGGRVSERRSLIKNLWPDKALYASTMVILTGVLGALYGLALIILTVNFDSDIPALIRDFPLWATVLLSLASAALAWVALMVRNTWLTAVGALLGIAAMGFVGIGSILCAIALVFVALSRFEGEDLNPATRRLDATMWPDKSLAASVLTLMTAIITLVWAWALMADVVAFDGYLENQDLFGYLALACGLIGIGAAISLYFQRVPWLAFAGTAAGLAGLALYMVGPILALAGFTLTLLAYREREFQEQQATAATP
jgi:hypothetical protein